MTTTMAELTAGLLTWVRRYASPDPSELLPDGVVNWHNRKRPFIHNGLDVGIYLKMVKVQSPGRPNRKRATIEIDDEQFVQTTYESNDKLRLTVQAVSLNDTDEDSALTWLDNLSGQCWTDESLAELKSLGCSIVSKADIVTMSNRLDDREPTVGTFEIVLHHHAKVLGLPVPFVQAVSGTGHITNAAVPDQDFEVTDGS